MPISLPGGDVFRSIANPFTAVGNTFIFSAAASDGVVVQNTNAAASAVIFSIRNSSTYVMDFYRTGVACNVPLTLASTLELRNATSVTTSTVAQMAFDTNAWASDRGAIQVNDGTSNTYVVATLASDTPINGQVPTWNTGGTITWETPSSGSTPTLAQVLAEGSDGNSVSLTNIGTLNMATDKNVVLGGTNGYLEYSNAATAPATASIGVATDVYGGVNPMLGSPDAWFKLRIGGLDYRVPAYVV